MNKIKYIAVVFFVFSLMFSINLFSQENRDLDSLYQKKLQYKKEVYEKTLQFLKENPDAPNAARLYFNLAEMSTEINIDNPAKTAKFYKMVLKKDPNFPARDVVLYNIGYYSFEAAKKRIEKARIKHKNLIINWPDSLRLSEKISDVNKAINAYKILINYYPDSQYHSEALYRLGDIYFELALNAREPMKYYPKAIQYFNQLANKVGDSMRTNAIFQRGWTYFLSGDYQKAIDDFTKILKVIKQDSLSEQKSYFEDDAIENIAYSLIEFDGTNFTQYSKAAQKLKEIFSNFVSEDYAKEIILNAIKLKLKYYAPMQAIDLYNSLIALFPTNIDNPSYNDSIISIYKNYPKRTRNNEDPKKLIVKEYIRITKDYSINSKWFQANKDKDISKQLDIIFHAYNFVEKKYYNNFAKNQTPENYDKYRKLVEDFSLLADTTGRNLSEKHKVVRQRLIEAALSLAAKTRAPKYYFTAISNIKSYIKAYPHDEKYFDYNKNLFLITENLYETLKDSVKTGAFIDTTLNVALDSLGLDSLLITASQQYENVLSDSLNTINEKDRNKELARIILIRADLYKKDGKFDKAIQDYKSILTLKYLDKDLKQNVYATLAYIYQGQGDYVEAEKYYRLASALANKKQKQDLENNILATIKASAETNLQQGDYEKSAQEFLRLARELKDKDPKQSVGYTVKAIEVYKKAGQYQKAIDLYVKIADSKKEKLDVLAALKGAWTISDSLLKDLNQTIALKQKFIQKYPASNEAYLLRLQLIKLYDDGPLADKEKAAEMYLTLFNDAHNKKIDIGTDKEEDIYLNALRIYEELGNEDKIIDLTYKFVNLFPKNELNEKLLKKVALILDKRGDVDGMLAFEKKFPKHPLALDLLKRVAFIYKSRGDDKNYEDLAVYIHKKYPSVDLLTEIAAQKLKNIKSEIDSLFENKEYDLMYSKIEEFKKVENKYKKDGIKLDLKPVYERFDYYDKYIAYHKKYDEFLSKIDNSILNKTPNQLIKVNKLTTWKRHLNGGKKRIRNLMLKCSRLEKEFLKLVKEGKDYAITDDEIMKGLLKIGKMYDYSTDVVVKQVDKYTNISNELNGPMWKSNPLLQKKTKEKIRAIAKQYSLQFLTKAIKYYGNLLTIYKENKNYENEYTEYAEKRLKEVGYLKEKAYEHYYTDNTWKINKEKINNYSIDKDIDSLWTNPKIVEENVLENAKTIDLPQFITSYLTNEYNFDILPELLEITYAHNAPINIYVNGIPATMKPTKIDTIQIGGSNVLVYKQKIVKGLTDKLNSILFKIPADSSKNIFAADIKVQYDKEKLEFYRTTVTKTLITDLSWKSIKRVSDISKVSDIDKWQIVGKGYMQYFKPQLYGLEDSKAIDIWSKDLDTTKVQTRYFAKVFDIAGDVVQAKAVIAAQDISSMYVNGKNIYKGKKLLFDESLKQAVPITVSLPLKKGKNIILFRVIGGLHFKGLLADITYTYKKNAENNTNASENKNEFEPNGNEQKKENEIKATTVKDTTASQLNKTTEPAVKDSLKNKIEKDNTPFENDNQKTKNKGDYKANITAFTNSLVSDYQWFTLKGNYDYLVPLTDSLWTMVGKPEKTANEEILKEFKSKDIKQIWYPESTQGDSSDVYFVKTFEKSNDNQMGVIEVYCPYPVSIWVNNEKIADNVYTGEGLEKIQVKNLQKGKNTIYIKVERKKIVPKEFFVFELFY